MGAPLLYALRVVPLQNDHGEKYLFCYNVNLTTKHMLWYRSILVLLQYVIPLTVISCVYARMGFALWGATAPGNAQTERDAQIMRNKKKVSQSYYSFFINNGYFNQKLAINIIFVNDAFISFSFVRR